MVAGEWEKGMAPARERGDRRCTMEDSMIVGGGRWYFREGISVVDDDWGRKTMVMDGDWEGKGSWFEYVEVVVRRRRTVAGVSLEITLKVWANVKQMESTAEGIWSGMHTPWAEQWTTGYGLRNGCCLGEMEQHG